MVKSVELWLMELLMGLVAETDASGMEEANNSIAASNFSINWTDDGRSPASARQHSLIMSANSFRR